MDATRFFFNFSAYYPGLSPFVSNFKKALVNSYKLKIRMKFLQDCLNEQVVPKSFLPRRLLDMTDRPFDDFQRIVLQKQIDLAKVEVKEAFRLSKSSKYSFEQAIPVEWKNCLRDYCYGSLRFECNALENKLKRKLDILIENSKWTKDANPNFVINLSNKQLDKTTKCALGYGLSFATSSSEVNSVEIAKAFCNLEKRSDIPSDEINICKGIVYGALSTPINPNCPRRFTKAYQQLKRDDDLHITKADKSNAIVIMNKVDYLEKMENLLSDTETYENLTSNPLENVNSNFNKKIKNILRGNDTLIKQLTVSSATLPYMYGLIKTHKQNNPVRPIISSVGSISYRLSKYLVKLLSPLLGNISNSNIKNNVDLVDKLNNLNLNFSFKIVSFDVTSLFTKVPVDDLLDFLKEELESKNLPLPAITVIELIKLCIKDSKFIFNGKFYSQKFGMAMGNPLSPLLSNLYMEFFETKILNNILPANAVWFRYVDDILCVWPETEDINRFLHELNNLVPSIKFTLEIESNGVLPFLDVNLHRINNSFKFSIYRKPTNVCSYVHYYSSHPNKVKLSVFSSMFLRALRICSPEFMDEEVSKIYNIAFNLKYPKSTIDKSFSLAKRSFYNNEIKVPYSCKNLLVLPFNEKFNNITTLLGNLNINVAFKNNNTLKTKLIKNSPCESNGCVYKIPCKECDKVYVGQTGKDLPIRIKQHKYSVRTGQESNALFIHMRDENHPIEWNKASKLVNSNSLMDRNIIESSIIKHKNANMLNLSHGLYKLDPIIINKIAGKYNISEN